MPTPAHNPTVILLAEDDILVRMALAEYLRGCAFLVIEAAGALEAREVLRSGQHVDTLMADAQLAGGEGGFGLARWIRRNRKQIRVVLIASLTSKIDAAVELCGAGDEPVSPRSLLSRIQKARARSAAAAARTRPKKSG